MCGDPCLLEGRIMCGRIKIYSNAETFEKFQLDAVGRRTKLYDAEHIHTTIPGNEVPAIVLHHDRMVLTTMHWGFEVYDKTLYNARAETVEEKKTWAESYHNKRMAFPIHSFFEHKWFHPTKPMAALGIYRRGTYDGKHFTHEASMLTKPADETVKAHHPRMPIMLPADQLRPWLNMEMEIAELLSEEEPLHVS